MAGNCSKEDCYPEETGCNYEGCEVLKECPHYKKTSTMETIESNEEIDSNYFLRIPWTGNTFGLQDLNFLSSTSKVTLIGITGVASAGKTTFLATLYCLLRNGHKIGDYHFSGSLTLNGWENIAWYLSWKHNNNIQFPPHTSGNSGRVPGLLHLSLRNSAGEKKEIVFTDAPGEWFDSWTINQNDPNAEGANWIHKNADAFLLFSDCEMLAGEGLGKARRQIRQVSDRIKQNLGSRPFGLIWSKSDIELDEETAQQISGYITNSDLDSYSEFKTSVHEGINGVFYENILQSISWLLETLSKQVNKLPAVDQQCADDMFLSKR